MNHKPFSEKLLQKIQFLDREGNINGVIAETAKHYSRLNLVRPELLEKICHYLGKQAMFISPQSVEALKTLPSQDLKNSGISAVLRSFSSDPPPMTPGHICSCGGNR